MKADQTAPTTIDEYIAGYPPDVQKRLKKLRSTIKRAAPQAQEAIKYRMPTFTLHGNLVHFAVFKAPHRPVSCADRHREIQERAVSVRKRERFGKISAGPADSF
jgi:uncharacterized protein YdhG (YjbR/CyaY superfamily)